MRAFLRRYPFLLLFGTLQIFFSAPGQTFLIALFVPSIFQDMGVSQSAFAGMYSAATLSAALFLNPVGRLIDRYPVATIVKVITILMAVGCFSLALAQNLLMVFISFFLLRLVGQGAFGLTASTLMIKTFERNRGKSMGIITLGFPLSEAVYPSLALFLLATLGWRMSYVVFGLSYLGGMLPLQLFLLRKANVTTHGTFIPEETAISPQRPRGHPEERKIHPVRHCTLQEALRDGKFYLLLAASCLPPMVVTGLFFHQGSLFAANHWPLSLAAGGLLVYAVVKALSSVYMGVIVDRYGPLVPFTLLIILLGLGTFFAALGGSPLFIYVYFILIGAALGFSSPVMNVVWPHFYGTKHMGSIKGMIATFRNGLTALGPLPLALAMDAGVSIQLVVRWTAGVILLMSLLPLIVWKMDHRSVGEQ